MTDQSELRFRQYTTGEWFADIDGKRIAELKAQQEEV